MLFVFSGFAQRDDFRNTNFARADSIARLYPKYPLRDIYGLSQKLTSPLPSEVEKFRAIYQWVCINVENDFSLYMEANRMREKLESSSPKLSAWNRKFNARVFQRLMNDYKSVCSGYSYLIKELSIHAGLSCYSIGGYGRTVRSNIGGEGVVNHSWNSVNLNGKWYLCDATWSSGAIDEAVGQFIPKYDDAYFLAEPGLFVRNHYPLDTTWMLLRKKPTLQQFLNRPLTYTSIYKYQVKNITPESFNLSAERGQEVSWRIDVPDTVPVQKLAIQINQTAKITKPFVRDNNGRLNIRHMFTTKGIFAFHLLINDEYVASYSVDVQ